MKGHPSPFAAIVLAAVTVGFAVSPFLVPEFSGFRPDQFPVPQIDPPVQPAGYAFAIWGVIYAWLLIGAGYGLFLRADAVDWHPMRPALTLSLAVGAAWLPVATLSPFGATALIWIMLVSALMALARAPVLDRWWGRAPVALYAGWLTAAASVSIGLVLAGYGLTGPVVAAVIALLLALGLALWVLRRLPDIAEYGFAVVWALAAIAVANLAQSGLIALLALAGLAGVAWLTYRESRTRPATT